MATSTAIITTITITSMITRLVSIAILEEVLPVPLGPVPVVPVPALPMGTQLPLAELHVIPDAHVTPQHRSTILQGPQAPATVQVFVPGHDEV